MEKIRQSKRIANFTTVYNDFLQDVNLSWKAKGLLTYIRSLPPEWELNLSDLKNRSKDGRDATANGLKELIDQGYCKRVRIRGANGVLMGYDYEVSDIKEYQPETENPVMVNPNPGNPTPEIPKTDNPITEKPTQINTNSNKDLKEKNTHSINDDQSLFPQEPVEKKETKTLFRNCKYSNLDLFLKQFSTEEFAAVDMVFYYHSVSDWSDTSNTKRTAIGWLATARTFVRKDARLGKLKLKAGNGTHKDFNTADALQFLKDDY